MSQARDEMKQKARTALTNLVAEADKLIEGLKNFPKPVKSWTSRSSRHLSLTHGSECVGYNKKHLYAIIEYEGQKYRISIEKGVDNE